MVFWRSKKNSADQEGSESGKSDQPGQIPQSEQPVPDDASGPTGEIQVEPPPKKRGLLSRMKDGLTKTRRALNTDIRDLFKSEGRLVDEEFLGDLFERLIRTDMGIESAEEIRDDVARRYRGRVVQFEEVIDAIVEQITTMLQQDAAPLNQTGSPTVILVVGVNGSGKTTSIGKLAYFLHHAGNKVMLGAGDTFRRRGGPTVDHLVPAHRL